MNLEVHGVFWGVTVPFNSRTFVNCGFFVYLSFSFRIHVTLICTRANTWSPIRTSGDQPCCHSDKMSGRLGLWNVRQVIVCGPDQHFRCTGVRLVKDNSAWEVL
ncbi:hypothetical protein CSUI_005599 [Cystoisospora suis]|uniref:Uncharacterized protein n=1 Tax=Cystoisospora suis TaxID=483139 RepID=A0A2C6KXE6_9APIC|nr:hypothetical protein CSUI_005599 [Cystoisospora suis]